MIAAECKPWTREMVIVQILQREANHDSLRPRAILKDNRPLYNAAVRKFGSWSQALLSAGVPLSKYGKTRRARMKNESFLDS